MAAKNSLKRTEGIVLCRKHSTVPHYLLSLTCGKAHNGGKYVQYKKKKYLKSSYFT
jgi:hypothetical protein